MSPETAESLFAPETLLPFCDPTLYRMKAARVDEADSTEAGVIRTLGSGTFDVCYAPSSGAKADIVGGPSCAICGRWRSFRQPGLAEALKQMLEVALVSVEHRTAPIGIPVFQPSARKDGYISFGSLEKLL
jgi:hypothetical protein